MSENEKCLEENKYVRYTPARRCGIGSRTERMGEQRRNLGGLIFCDLRDRSGIVQIVFSDRVPKEIFEAADSLKSEYVIGVKGTVVERESKNKDLDTGDIEVAVSDFKIYSTADTPPI